MTDEVMIGENTSTVTTHTTTGREQGAREAVGESAGVPKVASSCGGIEDVALKAGPYKSAVYV